IFSLILFQAEDGIRYFHVTGVQTCALPIYWRIMKKAMIPAKAYPRMTEGPANIAARPIPKNKPVPMAPPKAINCICRLLNPRFNFFSSFGCSKALEVFVGFIVYRDMTYAQYLIPIGSCPAVIHQDDIVIAGRIEGVGKCIRYHFAVRRLQYVLVVVKPLFEHDIGFPQSCLFVEHQLVFGVSLKIIETTDDKNLAFDILAGLQGKSYMAVITLGFGITVVHVSYIETAIFVVRGRICHGTVVFVRKENGMYCRVQF